MFATPYARRRLTALLVLALAALAVSYLLPSPSDGARVARTHLVQPGETVWGITAAAYGGDPRTHVGDVQRANRLAGGAILPGQVLVLP
jgi:hypothetical protein